MSNIGFDNISIRSNGGCKLLGRQDLRFFFGYQFLISKNEKNLSQLSSELKKKSKVQLKKCNILKSC